MSNLNVKLILEAIDKMTAPVKAMRSAFVGSIKSMSGEVGKLGKGVSSDPFALQQMTDPIRNMREEFVKSMREMGEHIEKTGLKLKHLGREITHIGHFAMERFTLPIVGLGGLALKEAADAQQLELQFRGIAGGAEKAAAMVKRLREFSEKSPFKMEDVAESAKQLMGMGYSADSAMMRLEFLGNAAAQAGLPISELTAKYIEIRMKGKASMEDLTELSRKGVPVMQQLAKDMGKTDRQVLLLAEHGRISFARFKKAMQEVGQGNGMAESQKNIGAIFEELKKAIGGAFEDVGKDLNKNLEISEKIEALANGIRSLARAFMALPQWMRSFIEWTALIVATLGPLIFIVGQVIMGIGLMSLGWGLLIKAAAPAMAVFEVLGSVVEGLAAALGLAVLPMLLIGLGIAALIYEGYALVTHWNQIKAWFVGIWDNMKAKVAGAVDYIMDKLAPLLRAFGMVRDGFQALTGTGSYGEAGEASGAGNQYNRNGISFNAAHATQAPPSEIAPEVVPASPLRVAQPGAASNVKVDTGGTLHITVDKDGNISNVQGQPNDKGMNYSASSGLMMGGF